MVEHGDAHGAHGAADRCPACGIALQLPRGAELGEVLFCDHCGMELEVVSLDPLVVVLFEEEEK